MSKLALRLRGVMIALVAVALSAGLAFAGQPATTGLANAALHAGKTVPVAGAQSDEGADSDSEASTDVTSVESDSASNCATDPTTLSPEELDAARHGSVVCWAAQQTSWPEWFANHGAFVSCWAHQGKAGAPSCTEDPAAQAPDGAAPDGAAPDAQGSSSRGNSAGHGKGKGKGPSTR